MHVWKFHVPEVVSSVQGSWKLLARMSKVHILSTPLALALALAHNACSCSEHELASFTHKRSVLLAGLQSSRPRSLITEARLLLSHRRKFFLEYANS